MKISMKIKVEEKQQIESFFTLRPALKKGETIKRWILQGLEADQGLVMPVTETETAFNEGDTSEHND